MWMTQVSLGQVDTRDLLAGMETLRDEVLDVRSRLRAGSIPHARLTALIAQIDESAFLITGRPASHTEGREAVALN